MKIVHSFWSKPILNFNNKKEKSYGGWRQLDYLYMSWALSCLTFCRQYKNIELVTDKAGYNLLVKQLRLPYTNVKIVLDKLDHYSERLWAIGKLYAYQIQKDPFIHVDGDVFIWKRFTPRIEKANLVTQQIDPLNRHYKNGLRQVYKDNFFLSKIIQNDLVKNPDIKAHNAGILGGNNLDFFEEYCIEAFKMIDANLNKYHLPFNDTSYALLYEQLLFSSLVRQTNQKLVCLIDDSSPKAEQFYVSNFQNKHGNYLKYVHLMGGTKNHLKYCYELRNQLQVEFPNYLETIEQLLHDKR